MAQTAYVDWDGLVYYDGKIKKYISNNLELCLKDGGHSLYNELPAPSNEYVNYIYVVTEQFTRTEELFGVNGGTYAAGTIVKVTEVTPGQYFYTILNEYTSSEEIDKFEDINNRITSLEENLSNLDPEKGVFYTKPEIDELLNDRDVQSTRIEEEIARQDKRIDELHSNQTQDHKYLHIIDVKKADKKYVDEKFENFTPTDLDNYYNKDEINVKFDSLDDKKSDKILFVDEKYKVTNSVGNFTENEIISNISITDLFTRLLGLTKYEEPVIPDVPTSMIQYVIDNKVAVLSGEEGITEYCTFEYTTFNDSNYSDGPIDKNEQTSIFYLKLDMNGEMESFGYQIYTPNTDRSNYSIAIPTAFSIKNIMMWDVLTSKWVDYTAEFSKEESTIKYNELDYTVYVSDQNTNNEILRFILEEVES